MSTITLHREPLPETNNFLQSSFWAQFKEYFGWQSHSFRVDTPDNPPLFISILSRKLAPYSVLAYIPHPSIQMLNTLEIPHILTKISTLLKAHIPGLFIVRWDLHLEKTPELFHAMNSSRLRHVSDVFIQPQDTTIVDLQPSLEVILERMHKKTRYNIKLAEKKGVKIVQAPLHDIIKWYAIYKETAERDRISIHPLAYYQKFFSLSQQSHAFPQASLFLAYHEEDLLAGVVVLVANNIATYVYGASSNHKRNLMPNYALQWHAIRHAKEQGCIKYDLFGIPPSADENHPMHGLYQFKISFGGSIHHHIGLWDAPVGRLRYLCFRIVERLRHNIAKWKKR
ncbi:peptidoglycan bridge formation glycyltransferase FemA/FemB family protein [Entomospira entomophila]|uniref:Peptidoglycan bridge formation glycyltransferase FemA/FemB family protein n=1 Tax=Entomospira entomophila TaxID=2719988 RepID=A0A968GA21_9SPIO|nr:peptidoglycan bridge formation glycyltransferase FemA/FemB family protein [Entomospira entomophilus]NIZ40791.1 peptidoglycan bridge formation glycyltransferase FemA/FemB family protein [Entomospira entomophilus]WDI35004.1 peptidoglycan bridge formation glycyltransferase FemA/FemB family protein [Entomospira entomophilus]